MNLYKIYKKFMKFPSKTYKFLNKTIKFLIQRSYKTTQIRPRARKPPAILSFFEKSHSKNVNYRPFFPSLSPNDFTTELQ